MIWLLLEISIILTKNTQNHRPWIIRILGKIWHFPSWLKFLFSVLSCPIYANKEDFRTICLQLFTGLPQQSKNYIPGLFRRHFPELFKAISARLKIWFSIYSFMYLFFCLLLKKVASPILPRWSTENLPDIFKDFPRQQKNPGLFQDVATLFLIRADSYGWSRLEQPNRAKIFFQLYFRKNNYYNSKIIINIIIMKSTRMMWGDHFSYTFDVKCNLYIILYLLNSKVLDFTHGFSFASLVDVQY